MLIQEEPNRTLVLPHSGNQPSLTEKFDILMEALNNGLVTHFLWGGKGGGGGSIGSIFARYVLLASQDPYPFIVYFMATILVTFG